MSASLGIDVGSTNVKAAVVSPEGDLVAWAQRPLATVRDGDRAEQDAEALWDAVVDAVGELTQGRPAVATVGVCSQYSSIVPVGADLRPVAPMAMYWDQRGTDHSWAILERHEKAFEAFVDVHGIPPIGSGLSLGHLLHFQLDRPEVHAATAHYLEPMDFVVARLTGRVAATQATMFMAQVVDNRSVGTTAYDQRLVELAGVDLDRLPPLVGLDEVVGSVVGVEGLEGASVRVGMNDSAAGALAAGVYAEGRGGLAVGTTAVLLDTVADKRVDLEAELVSMPSSVPGRYLAWAENGIAGKAVEHGLGLLGASFAELEATLAVGGPSSNGCLFLPWLTGSIAPKGDRNARGGWVGLSLDTTRDDLLRSMVEGTAHNLAWLLPAVEHFTGQEITSLGFFGGAGRSPGWAQVLADVLGRPVATLADPEVAVAAAVARNAQGAPPDAAPTIAATHEPRPDRTTAYQDAQARFEATFHALFA